MRSRRPLMRCLALSSCVLSVLLLARVPTPTFIVVQSLPPRETRHPFRNVVDSGPVPVRGDSFAFLLAGSGALLHFMQRSLRSTRNVKGHRIVVCAEPEATTRDEDRAAASLMLWYQIAGKFNHMHVKSGTTVSELRKKIKDDNKNTLDRVDAIDITIKNHAGKALEVDTLIDDVLKQGGTSTTTALYVHYKQPSASAATGSVSASDQQQEITKELVQEHVAMGTWHAPKEDECRKDLLQREDEIDKVKKYIEKVMNNDKEGSSCFRLVGTSGMKGTGKTQLLVNCKAEICTDGGKKHVEGTKGIYLTFNGQGDLKAVLHRSLRDASGNYDFHKIDAAFGHAMVTACGLNEDIARKQSFDASLSIARHIVNAKEEDWLVVFVDEVGKLDHMEAEGQRPVKRLLSSLMQKVDSGKSKVVFIFSHLLDEMLKEGAESDSGRKADILSLQALEINTWKKVGWHEPFKQWMEAAKRWAGVHQLLLSCAGHPRSLFDGLAKVLVENPTLLKGSLEPNATALHSARDVIIQECKFSSMENTLAERVKKWFNILEPMSLAELKRDGLCITVRTGETDTIDLFHPLLLSWWATKHAATHGLAFHLQRAYECDAELGKGSEKKMEGLLYHYETVLRVALNGQEVALNNFYKTAYITENLKHKLLVAKLPAGGDGLVECVQNFEDIDAIKALLEKGITVVSNAQSEVGIEYLSPWISDRNLLVACVQCKFVQTQTNWKNISKKMQVAERKLNGQHIATFRVIYATSDQEKIRTEVHDDGVYFNETAMFNFTSKLGILRLHTQKLGRHMSETVPVLHRASSEAP